MIETCSTNNKVFSFEHMRYIRQRVRVHWENDMASDKMVSMADYIRVPCTTYATASDPLLLLSPEST